MAIINKLLKATLWVAFLIHLPLVQGSILKHDITSPELTNYSFKEVCQELGAKNLELISKKSEFQIECFNTSYNVIDFCLKKFPLDKKLTRAIIVSEEKVVKCERSISVMLSVSCDDKDLKYCFNPKKGCDELRKLYAHRLEVVHYSMLEKNLNCYFAKPIGENLNEN